MEISKDRLEALICSAYEAGWRGFLEMRDGYAASVVDEFAAEQAKGTTMTVGDFSGSNALSSYYYYTTTTSALPTITSGGEEVI